jgi:probable rRNA maturation factor
MFFHLLRQMFRRPPKKRIIGEIFFVSPTTVRSEALRRKIHPAEECLRVSVHGLLHLFGYDHATESDELEMFSLQEQAIARALPQL